MKDEQLADAVHRAEQARKEPRPWPGAEAEGAEVGRLAMPREQGSLVAFYAAQPFETAPELPLPEGAPHTKDHYFGLLSFTLLQTLEQRAQSDQLPRLRPGPRGRYRAARGTRSPTPFCEGDLDREVLGLRQWPAHPDIVLERERQAPR